MMILRQLFSVCALLAVAACGGGGGNTTPFGGDAGGGGGGGTTPPPAAGTVADLVIVLSSSTLANNSTAPVAATVTALDANRNAISGAAVTLAANSNAVVTVTSGATTNAQGQLLATVGFGSDSTPRTVTLTAAAGSLSKTAALQVVSGASAQPAAIDLITSASELGTGGAPITIQAFVKDASNNALANAPVVFTSNTGTLANVSANTNASGVATASFSSGSNKANRTATITVTSQTVSANLSVPITNTKLSVSGPSSVVSGNTIQYFVIATDSANNPIPNATIASASSLGNAITRPDGNVTNSQGSIRFVYNATNAGTDTGLKFSGLGAEVQLSTPLVVSGDDFTFVSPAASSTVQVNVLQALTVQLRVGGVPQANRTVNFAATGGTLSSATAVTGPDGRATVSLSSSAAGPVTVQASVAGVATSATLQLNIVATVPSLLVLQISPTALPINAVGSNSNNQAQVVARVTDIAANPVAGLTVNFTRVSDPSGGNLLQASAVTDSSGVATVSYRSGPESTASNGVRLRASVASNAAVFGEASLTVNQSALFITLGTGNTIENLDPQTYKKDWVAYVTDANGVAVNNVALTNKLLPLVYRTGRLVFSGSVWGYTTPIYECRNEDADNDGVLDSIAVASVTTGPTTMFTATNTLKAGDVVRLNGFSGDDASLINGRSVAVTAATPASFEIAVDTAGKVITGPGTFSEDSNGDGVLWPGNVIAVTPASAQTAAGGRATLSLIYAESFAPWVGVRLTASATVAGTESRRDAEFVVNGSAADFSSEQNPPAGVTSPFGLSPLPALISGQVPPAVGGLWPNNAGCRRIL